MSILTDRAYLDALNEAQRAAVEYNDGPALVLAGAGSGKTRVLVYKLLHLLHSGYEPQRLMALTFTNKAAREMRQRIASLVGDDARYIKMGTFHSIFLKILSRHAELLGYRDGFSIYDSNDSKSKVKNIIKLLALDEKVYKPSHVCSRISNAKNRLITPEAYKANSELIKQDNRANMPRIAEIYARYAFELKQSNAMDFDDLLMQTNILFRDHKEVLHHWQNEIDYLLIDEYQDTNFAQFMIARQLMQHKGRLFVVGDDAQSIYSFRGANIENMFSFEQTFVGAKRFFLEQNYRSSQTIVEAAKCLIARNEHQIHKDVFSLGEIGEPIEIHEATSGEGEANWVGRGIMTLRHKYRASYDQFAVLYRTNQQSRLLEQKLRLMGIPFRIWGGRSFFDHKEIMDVLAYFRLVVNEMDDEAMLRVINYPRRGIGDTTIQKLRNQALVHGVSITRVIQMPEMYGVELNKGTVAKLQAFITLLEGMRAKCHEEIDFYSLAEWIINASGIPGELMLDQSVEGKARKDNLQELLVSIDEYAHNVEGGDLGSMLHSYLNEVALLTDQDGEDKLDEARVTLMTVHASKGLEFPHVFIVGLEEQLFPSAMCQTHKELEEERRLLYVAITRAEKTCHISYARERFRNGRIEMTRPSRFLGELPRELLKRNAGASDTFDWLERRSFHGVTSPSEGVFPSNFKSNNFMPPARSGGKQIHLRRRVLGDEGHTPEPQHERIGLLSLGARVLHKNFGEGTIQILEGTGEHAKAIVLFDSGEEKKLLLRFAHLELI